jgi:pimeloyl-ACP methyl ester carboxylesterase
MRAYALVLFFLCSFVISAQEVLPSFQSFDGTKIAYKDQGNGQPILLIHGFISNGSSWYDTELTKALLNAGYRVIIPDLRGNGQSDRPQTPNGYADNAEVKDLKLLIDHVNIQSYIAVGYSRGSIILAELLTEDSRISKAVLGGMGIDFTNAQWDRRIAFADAFSGRTPLNEMTEGAVNYAKSIKADLTALGLLQEHQPATSRARLKKVMTKILVIAGDQDRDNGDPVDLKEALGNASLRIVSGDHNTTYRKVAFAKAVLEFIVND